MIHQNYVSTINVRKLKTIKKLFKLDVTTLSYDSLYKGIHYKFSGTKYYQEVRNKIQY